jgi:EpsI family protein
VPACSGMNQIISLVALSIPLAYFTRTTISRKIALVLISLPLGILANGLRIALIGLFAEGVDQASIHGPLDTFRVQVIFLISFLVLIAMSIMLRKKEPPSAVEESEQSNLTSTEPVWRQFYLSSLMVVALVVSTAFIIELHEPAQVPLSKSLEHFPLTVGSFSGHDAAFMERQLIPFSADEELFREYRGADGLVINLYIGYFSVQTRERKVVDYRRDWMHRHAERVWLADGKRVNKVAFRSVAGTRDVYFVYLMNGKLITNQLHGKVETFSSGLFRKRTNAAVILIETRGPEEDALRAIGEFIPRIHEFLP